MHFAKCPDGSSKCHSIIYMLSLKPRILLAPAGPSLYCVAGRECSSTDLGLVFASTTVQCNRDIFSCTKQQPRVTIAVKREDSSVHNASVLRALTQGDEFCSHA